MWLNALVVLTAARALAVQECSVDGKPVNPANGSTTAGVTGIMVCREDGRVVREEELRDGKFIGLRRFYEADGAVKESHINERGNREGRYVEKAANGRVRLEGQYEDGSGVGLFREFFEGGDLQEVSWQEKGRTVAAINYNPDGSLREIRCGTKSYIAEDRRPCGFEGAATETPLYSGRGVLTSRQTWQSGRMVGVKQYGERGVVEALIEDGRRVLRDFYTNNVIQMEIVNEPDDLSLLQRSPNRTEREWAPSGQLIHQRRFENGVEVESEDWFLNGNRGRKMRAESAERGTIRNIEHYSDDGTLLRRERNRGGMTIGVQQVFHKNGQLAQEDRYDMRDDGQRSYLAARRIWDESGMLVTDEEYFEDGSRKLK